MGRWSPPPLPARWSAAGATAFVGRDREIAALETAWLAACDGLRQAVFVGGEPGAGKSRLLAECCAAVDRLGAGVLVGRCVTELGSPYQPFHEPVAALLGCLAEGSVTDDGRSGAPPVMVERLSTIADVGGPGWEMSPVAGPAPLDERRQTFQAVVDAVIAAATDRPVVLALEDVHWASPTALQLLSYLIERTDGCRLLLVATHRTTAPDRSETLSRTVSGLFRLGGVQRIDLAPLDTEDITDYLMAEGQVSRARARSAAVILRDRTGGNPFFLREIWSDLAVRDGLVTTRVADEPPPQVVRDTVLLRMAGLSATAVRLAGLAAVLGEEVDAATLSGIAPTEDVLGALDSLLASGLLVRLSGSGETYRFAHALTREVILTDMPTATRVRAHSVVAQALEGRGAPVQLLAHHYAAAHVLGHEDKAVRYLREAAARADRALAHAEASVLFERAASLAMDRSEKDDLLLAAARSSLLACDFARSRRLNLQVATDGAAQNRLRAATAYEDAAWYSGGSGETARQLLSLSLPAGATSPTDPEHVRALASLARATALTGDHERAASLVDEALAAARRDGDQALVADVLSASMQVGLRPQVRLEKRRRADELIGLATRHGMWLHVGPASFHRCVIAYQDGDVAALDDAARTLQQVGDATGHRYWLYLARAADFARSLLAADFATASSVCDSLLEMGSGFGEDDTEGPYGVQSFMIRRETGGLEPVRPLVTGDESPASSWVPGLLALYTELGMTDAARRTLRYLVSDDPGWSRHQARWPAHVAFAAEAAIELQDRECAAAVLPWLEEFAGTNLVMGPFTAVFCAADRLIGGLLSVLGADGADACFASALRLDTATRSPLHRAHTLAQWARHADRVGETAAAAEHAREARELSRALGLVRVEALLPPANDRVGLPDGLTEREADVLRLLGEGLSNRELAARLYISENTAANHVRSILLKTGCANRTQAAMYAAGRGLLTGR